MSEVEEGLQAELRAIGEISNLLSKFDEVQRSRILGYITSSVGIVPTSPSPSTYVGSETPPAAIPLDPKRFFASKRPTTDIERVLVLAISATQNGDAHFDSARLLLELRNAAARQFNIIEAAKSAVKKGYFAPAGDGKRQVTLLGEEVAEALPDRGAVADVLKNATSSRGPARR